MTKREAIVSFRKKLQERNADSTFSNKDLYLALLEQAKWLVKREVSAGRIYRNPALFQKLPARDVIEVSTVPSCVGIKTNCKIYRTKDKLPEMWMDNNGPIIYTVTSIDDSTDFIVKSQNYIRNILNDPYQQYSSEIYCFFADGYLWFTKENPNKINIRAYYTDDVRLQVDSCTDCDENKSCIRFLDTEFMVPDWILAELFNKALNQLSPAKQLPDDTEIDKNPNRK